MQTQRPDPSQEGPSQRDPSQPGLQASTPANAPTDADPRETQPLHLHRERDDGIGYGNSSGYGSTLHFTDRHVDPMFRFRW